MKRIAGILVLCVASLHANVVDLAPQRGAAIPSINWTDESGRARQLSEFSGYPLILLPIYTRCPGPCLQNVDHLKAALADSANNPRQFRVLLFSFDPSDNAASLIKYRQRENIPISWSLATASQTEIDALLESIGVQIGKAGTEFTHPNIVLFLDSKLRVAKWIYGTGYSGGEIDAGLKIAGGNSDWVGRNSQLLYSLLLVAGSILCVTLSYYVMQFFSLRKLGRGGSVIRPVPADR